jgi:hypothetical protein
MGKLYMRRLTLYKKERQAQSSICVSFTKIHE